MHITQVLAEHTLRPRMFFINSKPLYSAYKLSPKPEELRYRDEVRARVRGIMREWICCLRCGGETEYNEMTHCFGPGGVGL